MVEIIPVKDLMMRKRVAAVVLACVLCCCFGQMVFAKYPWKSIPEKQYNWTQDKKTEWKVRKFTDKSNAGKIHLAAQFKSSNKKFGKGTKMIPFRPFKNSTQYFYVQGGVVTEEKYVFAVFTANDFQENYIYFADRSSGTVVEEIKGNWGHSNALYYEWGKNKVRVMNAEPKTDGCFNVKTYKSIKIDKCIARQDDKDKVLKGAVLTSQGKAKSTKGGWYAVAGWDAADTYWGQTTYYVRSSNAVMIYDKNGKVFRTLYIGKSASADGLSLKGELEDVSFDGDNNLFLLYNLTSTSNGAAFVKINYEDWHDETSDETANDDDGGDKVLDKSDDESEDLLSTEQKEKNGYTPGEVAKTHLDSVNEGGCTSFFPSSWCDKSGDSGIRNVAGFIIGIMTGMVLTAGTIGVIICGYIWLTARDSVEKVKTAKRRMLDIVIGIVAWILLATLANLIIPQSEENINSNYTSSTGQSNSKMI